MFAITAIAVVALLVFVLGDVPKFDARTSPTSRRTRRRPAPRDFLPFGGAGLGAALLYGIWFFLAVEGVPLAAEETRDPKKDMPRGIITAMLILLVSPR